MKESIFIAVINSFYADPAEIALVESESVAGLAGKRSGGASSCYLPTPPAFLNSPWLKT